MSVRLNLAKVLDRRNDYGYIMIEDQRALFEEIRELRAQLAQQPASVDALVRTAADALVNYTENSDQIDAMFEGEDDIDPHEVAKRIRRSAELSEMMLVAARTLLAARSAAKADTQ